MPNDSLDIITDSAFDDVLPSFLLSQFYDNNNDSCGIQKTAHSFYHDKNSNALLEEIISKTVTPTTIINKKVNFGGNQIKLFDEDSVIDPNLNIRPVNIHKKPILAKTIVSQIDENTSIKDWEENIPINNTVLLDTIVRCFNLCGLSQEDLDATDLVMTLQRLSFGITSAFKTQELCYKYMGQRQKEKLIDDLSYSQKEVENKDKEIKRLENLLQDLNVTPQHQDQINAELVDLQENQRALQEQLKASLQLAENSKSEKAATLTILEQHKQKIKQLTHSLEELNLDMDQLKTRYTRLQQDYNDAWKQRQTYFDNVKQQEKELEQLKKMLIQERDHAQKSLVESEHRYKGLLSNEQIKTEQWKTKCESHFLESEKMNATIQRLSSKLEEAKNTATTYKHEKETLRTKATVAIEKLRLFANVKMQTDEKILNLKETNKQLKRWNHDLVRVDVIMRRKLNETINHCQMKEKENNVLQHTIQDSKARLKETRLVLSSPTKVRNCIPSKPLDLN
ncbi:LAFE_0C08240g1_1 [Lachancea fermentati]|uniref:LAFE_0C08240g1_1 n=1 Tax=Lachancea fermentati TaxID=4955 RepID=A0A1G4M9X1_LACFM|nr:LAFE_0C08240g1_1 [Lachancea fermentati]